MYFQILKRFYILSIFFFLHHTIYSQEEYASEFYNFFNKQSLAGKVKAFDTLNTKLKAVCYPLVKAKLDDIKQQAIIDNQTDIINMLEKIEGELYFQNRNYSKAIPIFTDLLVKNKIKTAVDSARVLYFLKSSYISIHSLKKAIDIHKILLRLKYSHSEIDAWLFHPKLSSLYYEMKLYKECLSQQLLEYDEMKGNSSFLIGYFNNRGLFWEKNGNYDSALACFNKARTVFYDLHYKEKTLTTNDEFVIGLIEGNIGQLYIQRKDYFKAIPLLKKDILCSIRSRNYLNAAVSEIELSRCYLELNQLKISKNYLDSANLRLANIEDYKTRLGILKQYAIYYEKTGSQRLSLDYYKKYNEFRDSTEIRENLRELLNAQIANQMEEKENLILENQKKIKDRTEELSKQKTIKNLLFFGGIVLILIIIIVSTQLKTSNSQKQLLELKNKQIETRNEIINKSLEEKDLLIKEVHHRVKNNLQIISSLLKLQSGKTQNLEILNSLKEAQDRINSMALLHQLLYRNNQMTSLWFNEYLTSLISQLSTSFSSTGNAVTIESKLIELELDLDTAIPLGLITNELVSNAYKHAFNNTAGEIKIELSKVYKNTYSLKISDNGPGLPDNFDINNLNSLGLDIVSILSEQISAELKMYNNNGANFEIHFTKI